MRKTYYYALYTSCSSGVLLSPFATQNNSQQDMSLWAWLWMLVGLNDSVSFTSLTTQCRSGISVWPPQLIQHIMHMSFLYIWVYMQAFTANRGAGFCLCCYSHFTSNFVFLVLAVKKKSCFCSFIVKKKNNKKHIDWIQDNGRSICKATYAYSRLMLFLSEICQIEVKVNVWEPLCVPM